MSEAAAATAATARATVGYAWRGPRGSGKRTRLLQYLTRLYGKELPLQYDTWSLEKDDDEKATGPRIPYEISPLHLGFDVVRMSMSVKDFLESILTRWTGQTDLCLMNQPIRTRYLVLYHAHLLTDETVLLLQECFEQYDGFAILLTSELPVGQRLRDACLEIPVPGDDYPLQAFLRQLPSTVLHPTSSKENVWRTFFRQTLETWSTTVPTARLAVDIRQWLYTCLQRNLRWTDMIQYWIEAIQDTPWLTPTHRAALFSLLYHAESGAGWLLITSYRIPVLWEHLQLQIAKTLYRARQ